MTALFHDQVYYQVDGGFSEEVFHIVVPYVEQITDPTTQNTQVFLKRPTTTDNLMLQINMEIFEVQFGQELHPFNGLNEFLSSLVMSLSLIKHLPIQEIVKNNEIYIKIRFGKVFYVFS